MSQFINPFTDFGFKRLFGQENHKKILIGLLNALFKDEFVVKDVKYRDKEQLGMTSRNRTVIYDIYCTLEDGQNVIVEMQNKKEVNFDDRALYYTAMSIVAQGERGSDWIYKVAPMIGIYFLNFRQEGLGRAFRTDFEITKTFEMFAHTANAEFPAPIVPITVPGKIPFKGKLRMIFLQMPEFTKTESECTTDLEKMAYIMNHMEHLKNIPWAAQEELYDELSKVSNVAALSPQERVVYDENLKQYRDNLATLSASYLDGKAKGFKDGKAKGFKDGKAKGFKDGKAKGFKDGKAKGFKDGKAEGFKDGKAEGFKDGKAKGEKQKSREIARKMVAKGAEIEFIVDITGLTPDEIEALK
jgi:predicted transposase/invertase (TIGR01784 family)